MNRNYSNSRFAGEMLVAAELARLGYEVMLGNVGSHNTRSFDMTAVCPASGKASSISVKSLKTDNAFLIDPESILPSVIYVLVVTGHAGMLPKFYVVKGNVLLENEEVLFGKYGRTYPNKGRRGFRNSKLADYPNNWRSLDE